MININEQNTQIRMIQRQLMEMGFELNMINKLFTYYNITRLEQAIDYLDKSDNKWNHPFVNYSNERSLCLVCKDHYDLHSTELVEQNVIKRIPLVGDQLIISNLDLSISSRNSNRSLEVPIKFKNKKTCQICFESLNDEVSFLPCGDKICNGCVIEYLAAKINTAEVVAIKCPNHQCKDNYVFDESNIEKIISPYMMAKYKKFKVRSEISKNKNLVICPIEDCESYAYVIEPEKVNLDVKLDIEQVDDKRKDLSVKLIKQNNNDFYTCQNGHNFCIKCNQLYHQGINCEKKMEKEFHNYVDHENVKKCPQCGFFIKKDGGCNHITCGNNNCKYEFCWICMKPYSQYHYTQPFSTCYGLNYADDRDLMVRYSLLKYIRIIGLIFLWILAWTIIFSIVVSLPSVVLVISFLVTMHREINRMIKVKNRYLKLFTLVLFYMTFIILGFVLLPIGYLCLVLSPIIICLYVLIFSFITGAHFGVRRRPVQNDIHVELEDIQ